MAWQQLYKKGDFAMANMLTTKEATIVADLLYYEEHACKKARLYSRTLTNEKLAEQIKVIADNHESRFLSLLGLL
jgi:hypothetical protein